MARNLFDAAFEAVAPVRALKRAHARAGLEAMRAVEGLGGAEARMGGYDTTPGGDPWYRRWFSAPRSAAADTTRDLPALRSHSRDLVRTHPIAASAINTNVARAIGTGLAYSPQPDLATLGWSAQHGAEWRAEAMAEFSLWADSRECDWYGEQNFYELQDLVARSLLESGDDFTVLPDGERTFNMPYALRLQVLEADRVGNPGGRGDTADICQGVRRVNGRVSGYHVYAQHPGSATATGDRFAGEWIEPIGARSGRRRILHHFKRTRPELPRGVPYLAPVMGLFKLLGQYTDAEIKAAVVTAFLALIIETKAGTGPAPVFGVAPPGGAAPGPGNQAAAGGIELGPAAVIGLNAGEEAKVVNPLRPNPAFEAFVGAVIDQLGAGTFIGAEMLMKKYSTSYTAARAAFLDAWTWLRDVRTLVARSFCQPVLETWMAEAVSLGRLRAPGFFTDVRLRWAYTRAAWFGDSPGSLNPKDEVAAYIAARDGRLITSERASWELFGTDWGSSYPVMKAETEQMRADGLEPAPKAGAPAPQPAPAATTPATNAT